LILINTLVANNAGNECDLPVAIGAVITAGSLDTDGSCQLSPYPHDVPNVDPKLGPLKNNGGFSQTHALLAGSPAIDAANASHCVAADQRGRYRPIDGNFDGVANCDIGAFEVQTAREISGASGSDNWIERSRVGLTYGATLSTPFLTRRAMGFYQKRLRAYESRRRGACNSRLQRQLTAQVIAHRFVSTASP
jgi:hypothetical protein